MSASHRRTDIHLHQHRAKSGASWGADCRSTGDRAGSARSQGAANLFSIPLTDQRGTAAGAGPALSARQIDDRTPPGVCPACRSAGPQNQRFRIQSSSRRGNQRAGSHRSKGFPSPSSTCICRPPGRRLRSRCETKSRLLTSERADTLAGHDELDAPIELTAGRRAVGGDRFGLAKPDRADGGRGNPLCTRYARTDSPRRSESR